MIQQKSNPNLTEDENKQFEKIKTTFIVSTELLDRTISYYLQYKQKTSNIPPDQILLAMKCSFFIAEKSEIIQNVRGQKMRGLGLSLSDLIKTSKSDQFMYMLKQISKTITIKDLQAANEIKNIVEQISLLIKFSDKFQKTMAKLQIKPRNNNANYQNIFFSFTWLLFVESKSSIFPKSQQIIQNTCLLAHVIAFMVIYGWNYIRAQFFYKGQQRLNQNSSNKLISLTVKNKILQIFSISNLQFYEAVAKQFQEFIHKKFQKGIIKHDSNHHFLSPQILDNNYKKLDQHFNKNLDPNCLDHRIFFKQRTAILTPSKFTPFLKQGYLNKGKGKFGQLSDMNQKNKDNFTSHRILNYENYDKIENSDSKPTTFNQTKLPKNLIQSPSTAGIPLIQTPLAAGMQMFKYLNDKSKSFDGNNYQISAFDMKILGHIDKFFSRNKKTGKIEQIKKNLVFSLLKIYSKQFFQLYPKQNREEIQLALLGILIQIVCFVNNIRVEFEQIENELEISVFYGWKACDFILKNDRLMPIALKGHILDLQATFITEKIWSQDQNVHQISQFFRSQNIGSPLKRKIQRLCTRIIFQIAFQINQISSYHQLDQDFSQDVFRLLKNLLEEHIQIYQNKMMDQLILCAFYLISKVKKNKLTLGQFKQAYVEMNPHHTKDHIKLLSVNTPQLQDTPSLTLVQFYNNLFLQYAKGCLRYEPNQNQVQVNNTNVNQKKQTNQAQLLLKSPLKTIIPKQTNVINRNNELWQANKRKPTTQLTPQLYAYTQSPLLKNQYSNLTNIRKGATGSKKALDFDKQQFKPSQTVSKQISEQQNINPNVDEFLNKYKKPSLSQKYNIQNICPKDNTTIQSRANSLFQPKAGLLKPSIGNPNHHHNIK